MRSASVFARRDLLQLAALGIAGAASKACGFHEPRPKVAAVFTEFRLRSHAFNFLINLMGKILFCGQWIDPGVEVVSFYADQFPDGDMAREVSRKYRVPLFDSIAGALCLGGKELAVDAVLLVGEHGNYPVNELGQTMYPRKEFFDQCLAVMRRSNRFVPLFNDKHLSYRWDWSKEMYDAARQFQMPLLAGSSVPLAQRVPAIEIPGGAEIEEAVSIHGGGMESYDFHALEVLQSFIESRRGGETGISRVQLLAGKECERAAAEGRWSAELVEAAIRAEEKMDAPRQAMPPQVAAAKRSGKSEAPRGDHALLLTYKDGTKGTVLKVGGSANRWNFACRLRGRREPLATALYNGPWGNLNLFSALSRAICHFFRTGRAPYPAERTLLASGVLDAAMHSHHAGGKPLETPQLEFGYEAVDFSQFREMGESWKVITAKTPQPLTFEPQGS
jgi:hypothetical protein